MFPKWQSEDFGKLLSHEKTENASETFKFNYVWALKINQATEQTENHLSKRNY